MNSGLLQRDTIAGAVAREIHRDDIEGLAYKAQFDRLGSNALSHIYAAEFDARLMRMALARKDMRK